MVLTTPLSDIARSALRCGTTTAAAWTLVSIGVAEGSGVDDGGGVAGVAVGRVEGELDCNGPVLDLTVGEGVAELCPINPP